MASVRGVNLGGWFVLEKWMKPELFEGVSGPDETVFSREKKNPGADLQRHWETFITEADIRNIKEIGIDAVRLPLPWWLLGEKPYVERLAWIDRVIGWLEKHELSYLLDLHTAPGCQNGFDNGGITGVIDWPKQTENVDITIEKLVFLTKRYGKNPYFLGIEALNEPHSSIALDFVQSFYKRTYQALRPLTSGMIVFHDAFRPHDPSWKSFFSDNGFINVAFDVHIYYCFASHYATMPFKEIIDIVMGNTAQGLKTMGEFVPVIVGEWSLGLDQKHFAGLDAFQTDIKLRALADAQLMAYEGAFGWFFWSYRIERPSHRGWDFSRLVKDGILPSEFHHREVNL